MREIKFRAWDKNKNRMLSHSDLYAMDCSTDYPFLALIKGYYANSGARFLDGIDPVTMQYTGLEDKNGKEIYEGDIVFIKQTNVVDKYVPNNTRATIKFSKGAFVLDCDIEFPVNLDLYYNTYEEFEVIGNIYENPELLETKQ